MKLQIAFDTTDLDKAIEIAQSVAEYADILEIGTLLIYQHGNIAIKRFKETFPKHTILVDCKIVDRGKQAAAIMHEGGADWISVMAGTSNNVIHGVCTTAHENSQKVMLDLLDSSSLGQSAMEAKGLGINALMLHQSSDEQDPLSFVDKWENVRGNTELPIFISAKIKRDNIEETLKIKPDGIIVGRGIVAADNPVEEAQFFRELCDNN